MRETMEYSINRIREIVLRERRTVHEINSLFVYLGNTGKDEDKIIRNQIEVLEKSLRKANNELLDAIYQASIQRPLAKEPEQKKELEQKKGNGREMEKSLGGKIEPFYNKKEKFSELDKEILKRLKGKEEKKKEKKKEKKSGQYVKIANNLFGNRVKSLIKQKKTATLEKDLIKSNLNYTSISYISSLILTTILSVGVAAFIVVFFLFFNLSPDLPIITRVTEDIGLRFLKIFWLIFVVPLGVFLSMYFYPSLEKKSVESRINLELPFATIHMAAISGSLIEPIKVFSIISSTKEYPNLEKEFNKLLNSINVYGYDLVTALKNASINCPSSKLAELFNGLATTITSGGELYDFFDKRSQTLLFEYRLDKEKRTKAAETFMDIYISIVIAAPMILMLLLMMMKVSGIGVSLSTSTITFLLVGGVSVINIFFLVFLQLKQPEIT